MTRSLRPVLRRRRRVLLIATATAVLTAGLLPATAASSAEESPACPAAYPVDDLVKGAPVHGLTVSQGSTPDEFTGEVVGVIDDGIALGVDMVMVKLSGSVITDASGQPDRGIWAGMSGSPVYAEDGRLIGAVSYGLSMSPSEYAGVTPAAAMYDLGRYEGLTLQGTASVEATPRAVTQLRSFGVSASEAQAGFSRLPMPTSVSALAPARFGSVSKRLGLAGTPLVSGATAHAEEPAGEIVPGGNIAMALSYGDLTAAGVGTVTAVCGDAVLAFGHPFALSGPAVASLHGAEAVYVQRDDTFGSYKIANPTAPVGVFTQDRIAGILGRLGTLPATTPVSSTVTTTDGDSRSGSTSVVDPELIPVVATMHLLANLDSTFNGFRGGTGRLAWTITVRRPNGKLATLTRSDVYASEYDLAGEVPWDFYMQLSTILHNDFEKVDVVNVEQQARLNTNFRQYRLGAVQVRRDGRWVTAGRRSLQFARAGGVLRARTWLEPVADSNVLRRHAYFEIPVPRSARGVGRLLISGGGVGRPKTTATTLPGLLEQLAKAPTNNTVTAQFHVRARGGIQVVERRVVKPAPVAGLKYLAVSVD